MEQESAEGHGESESPRGSQQGAGVCRSRWPKECSLGLKRHAESPEVLPTALDQETPLGPAVAEVKPCFGPLLFNGDKYWLHRPSRVGLRLLWTGLDAHPVNLRTWWSRKLRGARG